MTDLEIIKELEKEYSIKDFYELDKDGEITSLVWDFSFKKISETKLGLKMLKFFIGFNGNIDMYDFLFEKIHIKNITISRTPNHQNSITWNDISSFLNKFSILNSFNFIFTNTYDIPSYDVFKELARLNLRVFFGSNAETIHSLINEYNYSNEKSVSKIIRILKDQKIGTSVFRAKSPFRILLDFSDLISSNVYINNYDLIDRLNSKTGKPFSQEKDIISRQFLKRIGEGNIIKFSSKYKTLPNCINQFLINGFHNISKMHIKGIPKNTQWIFLTGENGYGKSLILQALTIVFFGRNEDNGFLLDKSKTIKGFISLYEENFTSKKDNFQTYIFNTKNNSFEENDSTKNSFENFAAYGPARIRKSADRKSKTYNLFHNDGTLIDIEAKFREWYDAGFLHIIYEDVKKIFLKLLSPYIDDIKIIIDKEKSSKTVKYHEKESKDDVWLEYNELASGYKSIIATFGDMIIRLTEGNKSSNISELSGIVLIDEFDLHLHPKWQKELVEKLTKVFPKVQFIVSTHSPIPILGAPENSIIINVDRDKENGITAKILDVDFKNLTPNSILTSPIFNFHSIIPESNTDLKDLQTKDDYDDIIFQKKVKQKLNDFVQENKDIDKEFDNE